MSLILIIRTLKTKCHWSWLASHRSIHWQEWQKMAILNDGHRQKLHLLESHIAISKTILSSQSTEMAKRQFPLTVRWWGNSNSHNYENNSDQPFSLTRLTISEDMQKVKTDDWYHHSQECNWTPLPGCTAYAIGPRHLLTAVHYLFLKG